jgi:small-conductance mechanosensitive channel
MTNMMPSTFPIWEAIAVFVTAVGLTLVLNRISRLDWLKPHVGQLLRYSTVLLWVCLFGLLILLSSQYGLSYLYIELGLLAIFILGARDWLHQVVTGILLILENRFEPEELLKVGDLRGRVVDFYLRFLRLELDDGTQADVPYSDLLIKPVRHLGTRKHPDAELELTIPQHANVEQAVEAAKKAVSLSPLLAPSKRPEVYLRSTNEGQSLIVEGRAFNSNLENNLNSDVARRYQRLIERY